MNLSKRKTPAVVWLTDVDDRCRLGFERALRPHLDLLPRWCDTITVRRRAVDSAPDGSGSPVEATADRSKRTLEYSLPADWMALTTPDREVGLVFWIVLDALSRDVADVAGPVVDTVRSWSTPGSERGRYTDLLPHLGKTALQVAEEAVRAGGADNER